MDFLNCPKCDGMITPVDSTPGTCSGCHGVWSCTADYGAALTDVGGVHALVDSLARESSSASWTCPRCPRSLEVARHRGIEIEWCPDCHGLFLDRGELELAMSLAATPLRPQRSSSSLEEIATWFVLDLFFEALWRTAGTLDGVD